MGWGWGAYNKRERAVITWGGGGGGDQDEKNVVDLVKDEPLSQFIKGSTHKANQ